MRPERPFADYELSSLAKSLSDQFIQRWDLYPRQLDDGRYICVHRPLQGKHMIAHLKGEMTLGVYLLNPADEARFIVFDADYEKQFSDLVSLAMKLKAENIPTYLEKSRRGGHLWFFFSKPIPGSLARSFGQGVLTIHSIDEMELFPKQDRLTGGPGSLIRMPFGMHRRSNRLYGFYKPSGQPIAPTIRQQTNMLSNPQIVPEDAFDAYRSCVPYQPQNTDLESSESPKDMVSERIKSVVSVSEFISQYVELRPSQSGGLGLCPFHEDHKPSLSVNDKGNYWNCFAGCGGGSIIDFWMRWSDCDFTEAVTELAHKLL